MVRSLAILTVMVTTAVRKVVKDVNTALVIALEQRHAAVCQMLQRVAGTTVTTERSSFSTLLTQMYYQISWSKIHLVK